MNAADYARGFLRWKPTDGLQVSVGTGASREAEIEWSEPITDANGSLVPMDIGAVIAFRFNAADRLDPNKFWIKLESVRRDVVHTRIWHGIPNGAPVILSHVPGYGHYRRLVVDGGSLDWDSDCVFREPGFLVRFVTGNIQGEMTDELKPINGLDGKITLQGGQKTAVAKGRFIEVVAQGESAQQAELHAQAVLGLLALALGQNVLGRIVFSEPWYTTPDQQMGDAVAFGSEVPRSAHKSEFDQIGGLIAKLTQPGRIERARVISLRWYERGFRAREPLDMLLSFYIGIESLVAAFCKANSPIPVEAARDEENQAILERVRSLGKVVLARVSQRIRGASIREQFQHYATSWSLAEAETAAFAKVKELRDDAVHGDQVEITPEVARDAERLLRTMLKAEFAITGELAWEKHPVIHSVSIQFSLHTN
jgi:hypothetical protein